MGDFVTLGVGCLQELANLAWALVVLDVYDEQLFRHAFQIVEQRMGEFDEGDLNQLYQVRCLGWLESGGMIAEVGRCLWVSVLD
jgi:hypothetical protein